MPQANGNTGEGGWLRESGSRPIEVAFSSFYDNGKGVWGKPLPRAKAHCGFCPPQARLRIITFVSTIL